MKYILIVLVALCSCNKDTVEKKDNKEEKGVRVEYIVKCFSDSTLIIYTDYRDSLYTSSSVMYKGKFWSYVCMFPDGKFLYTVQTSTENMKDSIYQQIKINDTIRGFNSGHGYLGLIVQY